MSRSSCLLPVFAAARARGADITRIGKFFKADDTARARQLAASVIYLLLLKKPSPAAPAAATVLPARGQSAPSLSASDSARSHRPPRTGSRALQSSAYAAMAAACNSPRPAARRGIGSTRASCAARPTARTPQAVAAEPVEARAVEAKDAMGESATRTEPPPSQLFSWPSLTF